VNLSVNILISRRISLARQVIRLGTVRNAFKGFSQTTLRENTVWKKDVKVRTIIKINLTCIAPDSMDCICLVQLYRCEYGNIIWGIS